MKCNRELLDLMFMTIEACSISARLRLLVGDCKGASDSLDLMQNQAERIMEMARGEK